MAGRLTWTKEALDDIDGIADYISRDSLYYAKKVVKDLFDSGDGIEANPRLGRVVPELRNEQIRERFIYSYRVIYEMRGDEIQVLAVLHGKRLLASIDDRFDPSPH